VIYANNQFVATTQSGVMTSPNGTAWTSQPISTYEFSPSPISKYYRGICAGPNLLVVVGDVSLIHTAPFSGATNPTTFDTATSGNWNAPATWTCNCVPDGSLPVQIMSNHVVTVPGGYTALAKQTVRYMATGRISLQATGRVRITN
jgi:hypothetical protein